MEWGHFWKGCLSYRYVVPYLSLIHILSGGISFTVSVIYNYILSVKWVFDAGRQEDKKKEFLWFVTLSVIGLGLNQLFLWIFAEVLHVFYMFAKIIVTAIVMVYNFVTRKIFLEKRPA